MRDLSRDRPLCKVPVGEAVALLGDDHAKPLQALQVFGDGVQLFLGVLSGELGGDLGHGPFAGGGAEEVADGGELLFGLGGPLLLLDGFDDRLFGFDDTFEGGLGGLHLVGCLVLGAEPADEAVTFFFGAFGVEGDEAIEDLLVE